MNKKKLHKDFALFLELVRTDFKLRYQGSILGYVWTLLKPLILFAILFTVFTKFLRLGSNVPNYPQSLLLGIVLWTFFVEATTMSLKSVVGKGNLIRKISIPRYMIPLSVIASALINMLLNLIVVFIFVLFAADNALSVLTILFLPPILLQLVILSSGAGFMLAALYVKFRDMDPIWEIVRQALFYTIPIIYPLTIIPNATIQKIIMMNPLSQIIQDARVVVTYSGTTQGVDIYNHLALVFVPYILTIVIFVVGLYFFKKQSKHFAENI
jgi:ABC-2 type transport system permease protein